MFTYLQIRVCSELEHDKIRLKVSEANKAAKSVHIRHTVWLLCRKTKVFVDQKTVTWIN